MPYLNNTACENGEVEREVKLESQLGFDLEICWCRSAGSESECRRRLLEWGSLTLKNWGVLWLEMEFCLLGMKMPGTSSTFLLGNTTTFLSLWSASRSAFSSATSGEEPRRVPKYGREGVRNDLGFVDSVLAVLQSLLIAVALFHLGEAFSESVFTLGKGFC